MLRRDRHLAVDRARDQRARGDAGEAPQRGGLDQRALLRRHYLGFVFQGFNLLKRTTALENLELPLIYRGLGRLERHARGREVLAQVGLSDREHHTASELSGGQQQRVAIGRALASEPAVIFADEPTGNLDTAKSHEIMQLFQSLNATRGLTIVLVTHDEDVASYARRKVRWFCRGLTSTCQPRSGR